MVRRAGAGEGPPGRDESNFDAPRKYSHMRYAV